jgi:hypothetical protein
MPTNFVATTDGGVVDISGTAIVSQVYNDVECELIGRHKKFGCKIGYPNKYRQCFEVRFYTTPKRNIFPKSFTSTGAYLPAITRCIQYLYLPPQSKQDVQKDLERLNKNLGKSREISR